MSKTTALSVDVLVLGAGPSGLSAAWDILKDGRHSVHVVEASERVGGRTFNHTLPSDILIERGGAWAGPTQTALLALAKDLGVVIKDGKPEGKTFYGFGGRWNKVEFPSETAPVEAQRDFERAMARFEMLCRTVPTDAPWTAPAAETLDAMSVGDWIHANTHLDESRAWFTGCIRKLQGGDPDRVSLLWMLHFVRSASFEDLLDTAEDYRFVGGAQSISLNIASKLGDRLWLNAPATLIDRTAGDCIAVETPRGRVAARQLIVATMPASLRGVVFVPELPADHRHLIAEWGTMSWIKFNAIYDRPFWRSKSSGRQFLCLDRLVETFDISPRDESWGEIVGFILPDSSGRVAADRAAYCRDFLREVYGEGADTPRELAFFDWNEQPWVGGCVSATRPGLLIESGSALREPVGRIHWAGTERSATWVNYIEGAVRAGQRAARETLTLLSGAHPKELTVK